MPRNTLGYKPFEGQTIANLVLTGRLIAIGRNKMTADYAAFTVFNKIKAEKAI